MEHRVRFELTVFRICNPVRWTAPPPVRKYNMQTYDVTTPDGLQIHLSISRWDTGYIFINDIYDDKITFKYFTDMRTAIYFIKSYFY